MMIEWWSQWMMNDDDIMIWWINKWMNEWSMNKW